MSGNRHEKEVRKKLEEKGFPLEVEVHERLQKNGWNVTAQEYYFDEDEAKARTVDLASFKRTDIESSFFDFFHRTLVIECKSSRGAWVFYVTKKGRLFNELAAVTVVKNAANPKVQLSMLDMSKFLSKSHYYLSNYAFAATNWCVLNSKDTFFEALNQVLKALVYNVNRTRSRITKLPQSALMIFYPIIIFQGSMYEYTLGQIRQTQYVQYECHGISRYDEPFVVDVVRKEFFQALLDMLETEHSSILTSLTK
jgi:hypothetical protein